MRRLLFAVLAGAMWCIAVHGGAPAKADPLPPCVDGQYGTNAAGAACQVRGDTTPTARCWDGSFDYTRSIAACSGHGGVLEWLPTPAAQASPATVPTYAAPAPSSGFSPVPGSGTGPVTTHTWYTSSQPQAYLYYCDDDPNRLLNDLPQYQVAFPTVAALLAAFPGRVLDQPCADGSTGP